MRAAEWTLNSTQFADLFPFHIAMNRELQIVQTGMSLGKCCAGLQSGDLLTERFQILNPDDAVDFDSFLEHRHMLFVLKDRLGDAKLRGQISPSEDPNILFFLGSPWLAGNIRLQDIGLSMPDFALYDSTVDLLQVVQATKTALTETKVVSRRLADQKKELVVARDLAEAANRAKSQFLANMSHELRTPLNAIIGFSQMLGMPVMGELNERQTQYNKNIYSSANHLLNIINDILDLAKIEAGRLEPVFAECQLQPIFEETRSLVKPLAIERDVEIILELEEDLPRVKVDAAKLKQILINLMGNSVKFTAAGGFIKSICQLLQVSRQQLLKIDVIDSGCGIDPAKLETVFDEFAQVNESMTRASEGTGLGLALVRRLVTMHGGCIWAKSPVNAAGGTAMTILLPLDAGFNKDASMVFDNAASTCLIFDQAESRPDQLEFIRTSEDLTFIEVENRLDGFGRALLSPPALFLIAINPDAVEDDLLLIKQLRAIPNCKKTPLAIYSDEGLQPDVQHRYKPLVDLIFHQQSLERLESLISDIRSTMAPA